MDNGLFPERTVKVQEAVRGYVSCCDIQDYATFERARRAGGIIACFSGLLPEKVFQRLLAESTLPPVIEGANTTNRLLALAMKRNGPAAFISYETRNTGFLPLFAERRDLCRERCDKLAEILASKNPSRYTSIAQFILDALDPDSVLNQYFLGCARRSMLPGANITTVGILELVKYLKRKETAHQETTVKRVHTFVSQPGSAAAAMGASVTTGVL